MCTGTCRCETDKLKKSGGRRKKRQSEHKSKAKGTSKKRVAREWEKGAGKKRRSNTRMQNMKEM